MSFMSSAYHPGPRTIKKQNTITKLDFLKTRIVMKLLTLGVFIVILALFYIWSRIQIVQVGYEINALSGEQQSLKNDNKNLHMELLLLKSPQRIEKIAKEKLLMKELAHDKMFKLSELAVQDK
ncbi:MAG: FtsL-like putative cell division protein [bacterium]|nr:cell division protein FtsL [bacterium]MBU1918587.1 cell division protein FtsL [bacterium]